MNQSTEAAQFSQFETKTPLPRVVILGASNLSLMFPTVIESTRAMLGAPVEFYVAKGFGRSYGRESNFFGKKFPGILQSDLWSEIDRAPSAPTFAIVSDIGNDLAYESPVPTVLKWINESLDRLESRGARIVLNNVPIASLRCVGGARYRVFRELFFPKCKLAHTEMLRRAEELSMGLENLATTRKTPVFSGESQWYGLDPIHPRRSAAGEIWRQMLGALTNVALGAELVRPSAATSLQLHRLKPREWSLWGKSMSAAQPSYRLSDGTTIALY